MSCLHCKKSITGRHLALGCSVCCRWQHRKCNMGIDIMVYRAMVQGTIPWKCLDCRPAPMASEKMGQKEMFLSYFSLGQSKEKTQFPSNVVDLDIGCHNDLLQVEEFATDMVCESQCVNLDMGEDICSDIPWLPKIETVYSEAIVQEDDYLNVKSNIDDSPLFSTPWLPIITSVYSEAVDHVNNGIKSKADLDSTHQIPCFPKIESVCSGDTTYENNLPSLDFDPAYRTDFPIENCPKCYTNLTPVQFTVNVVTAVMKTSCQCGLSIEITPKLSTFKGATIQRKRKRSESTTALKRLRLA